MQITGYDLAKENGDFTIKHYVGDLIDLIQIIHNESIVDSLLQKSFYDRGAGKPTSLDVG